MRVAVPRSVRAAFASPTFSDVVAPYVLQRTALVLAVCFGVQFFEPGASWSALPRAALLDPWVRWDSEFYLIIASVGYGHSPWGKPDAFFPLYPYLVRALGVLMPLPVAALVLAHAAALCAFVLLYRLALAMDDRETARRAVWLGLLFPTSFFLSAGYAESLYLALTIGAVFAWQRKAFSVAALSIVGACLARPPGVFAMSLPFALDWVVRSRRARDIPWFALSAGVGAALVFLTYQLTVGDPTAFVTSPTVQALRGVGGVHRGSPAPFWAVLLDEGMGPNLMRRLLNFSALVTAAAVTVHLVRRREIVLAGITVLDVGIPLIAHGTVFDAASMGRYLMVAFPLYIVLARWVPEGPSGRAVEYAFGALQMVLALIFGVGLWAE